MEIGDSERKFSFVILITTSV